VYLIYQENDQGDEVYKGTARGTSRKDARMAWLRKHPRAQRHGKLIATR
jgi:hypothetical protein